MAKLRGAAKEAFLKRMARGRAKAKRKNPRPKKKPATKRTAAKKSPKRTATKNGSKLRGKAKLAFLKRMQQGRRKAAKNPRPRKGKRNGRRNPDTIEGAIAKFEEFHGKQPGKVVDYQTMIEYRENFAEMGKLKELRFRLDSANPHFPLTEFKGAQAVCTQDGANIYFIGGDQSIDFAALDIASDKDMVELGPCTYISYHTVKGFHDFEPITYYHSFGEEDGILPVLCYDRMNKNLFLISGNYRVRPEGIVN